jgi:hypothetical protein
MEEQPGLSDQYRMASPWPVFVALGLVLSEVGVVFGVFPIAVGGLLLFGGSVAGITQEAGYVERPWTLLVGFGVVLAALGGALVFTQDLSGLGLVGLVNSQNGIIVRGLAVVFAGVILAAVGGTGHVLERDQGVEAL